MVYNHYGSVPLTGDVGEISCLVGVYCVCEAIIFVEFVDMYEEVVFFSICSLLLSF